jgi:predicted nucleic acid-binding protein
MPAQHYRVVLDTNQILAAGSKWVTGEVAIDAINMSRRVLLCVACSHTGLYSGKIIGEYLEKLVDRGHPPERAEKLVTLIMGAFARVKITTQIAPTRPQDLDDEVFLLCAIDGEADYLVSDDGHLLALINDYTKPVIGRSQEVAIELGA